MCVLHFQISGIPKKKALQASINMQIPTKGDESLCPVYVSDEYVHQ